MVTEKFVPFPRYREFLISKQKWRWFIMVITHRLWVKVISKLSPIICYTHPLPPNKTKSVRERWKVRFRWWEIAWNDCFHQRNERSLLYARSFVMFIRTRRKKTFVNMFTHKYNIFTNHYMHGWNTVPTTLSFQFFLANNYNAHVFWYICNINTIYLNFKIYI